MFKTDNLNEIRFSISQSKLLFLSVLFSILSMVGIPPFSGFISKELVLSSIKIYSETAYLLILILSLLTPVCSFKLLVKSFFIKSNAFKQDESQSKIMILSTFTLSLFTLLLNFFFVIIFLLTKINFYFILSPDVLLNLILFFLISVTSALLFTKGIDNSNLYLRFYSFVSKFSIKNLYLLFCKVYNKIAKKKFGITEFFSQSFYVLLVLVGLLIYIIVMLVIVVGYE